MGHGADRGAAAGAGARRLAGAARAAAASGRTAACGSSCWCWSAWAGPEHRRRPRDDQGRHRAHEHGVQVLPARLGRLRPRLGVRAPGTSSSCSGGRGRGELAPCARVGAGLGSAGARWPRARRPCSTRCWRRPCAWTTASPTCRRPWTARPTCATAVYNDQQGPISSRSDYEGIQWLRQNVEGTPAIVEGRADSTAGAAASRSTQGCLPSSAGTGTRRSSAASWRTWSSSAAGRSTRSTPTPDVAEAQRFLRRYDVQYVIVGQVESNYYPPRGLRKFETGLNGALRGRVSRTSS